MDEATSARLNKRILQTLVTKVIGGNPEAAARKLVDRYQLDGEDACLSVYDNKRSVKTLSSVQVRQPIYSSSVGVWKRHEKDLEPLIQILRNGGALDEWD